MQSREIACDGKLGHRRDGMLVYLLMRAFSETAKKERNFSLQAHNLFPITHFSRSLCVLFIYCIASNILYNDRL